MGYKGMKYGKNIPVRAYIDEETYLKMAEIVEEAEEETMSAFIRRAIKKEIVERRGLEDGK